MLQRQATVFLCISLLLGTINTQISNATAPANPNQGAPPPPTQSAAVPGIPFMTVPYTASPDVDFLIFAKLEFVKLARANLQTTISYLYNNVAGTNNVSSIDLTNKPGSWFKLAQTKNRFSCAVLADQTNQKIGFLSLINNTLTLHENPANSPLLYSLYTDFTNVNNANIDDFIQIGENCNAFTVRSNLYRLNLASSTVTAVTFPNGVTLQDASSDFSLIAVTGGIYRWNIANQSYTSAINVSESHTYNNIEATLGGAFLYAWTYNSIVVNGVTTQVTDYNAYIYALNSTTITLIDSFSDQYLQQYPPSFTSSLSLTKIGSGYTKVGQTAVTIAARNVDYKNKKSTPVSFYNLVQYLALVQSSVSGEVAFSDYYLYVHNQAHNPPIEAAFQFLGSSLVQMKKSPIHSSSNTNWVKSWVDLTNTQSLIVYNAFIDSVNNVVNILLFDFGGLQQNIGVSRASTVPSATISFTAPTGATNANTKILKNLPSWTYIISANAITTVTTQEGTVGGTFTITGTYTLLAQNDGCKLFTDQTNYKLYKKSNTTGLFAFYLDVSSIFANTVVLSSKVSSDCQRIQSNGVVYYNGANGFTRVANSLTFLPKTDAQLNFAIITNSVWMFNLSAGAYSLLLSDAAYLSNILFWSTQGRLLVYTYQQNATNSTNYDAKVLVYSLQPNTTNLTKFYEAGTVFSAIPSVQFSPNMDVFIALGSYLVGNNSFQYTAKGISINYANMSVQTFVVLNDTFRYVAGTTTYIISLTTNFVHVLETQSANDITEYVLTLQFGSLKTIFKQKIPSTAVQNYKRSLVKQANGVLTVLTEAQSGLNVALSSSTYNSNSPPTDNNRIGSLIVDGKTLRCDTGCSVCTGPTYCSVCSLGFVLKSDGSCSRCPGGCSACSSATVCTSCFDGNYLSADNLCVRCPMQCFKCQILSGVVSCNKCPPGGLLLTNGSCSSCTLKNCRRCDSVNVGQCLECFNGFFPSTTTKKCIQCISACSSCSQTNITNCLSCAKGLELLDGSCKRCPKFCDSCSNGLCVQCGPGHTQINGSCVLSCHLPCLECVAGQPSNCTACFGDSILANATCNQNMTCLINLSCTTCSLGYALVAGGCYQCNTPDANCLQCSGDNTQICIQCKDGYYLDSTSGSCTACASNCRVCNGPQTCISCLMGNTLLDSATASVCYACQSPCLTCIGDIKICDSCIDNYTLQGWKCASSNNVGFVITFQASVENVLTNMSGVIDEMLPIVNQTDPSVVTITNVKSGSTIFNGQVETSDPTAALALINAAITSGTSLGGFSVSSVTLVGTDGSSNSNNINALAIGLGIGIPAALSTNYVTQSSSPSSYTALSKRNLLQTRSITHHHLKTKK